MLSRMANSECHMQTADPDQTAPKGAVWSGSVKEQSDLGL